MEPRHLNPLEREVIQWLLDKARMPAEEGYPDAPDNLRVVGHCDCGCLSMYFEHERGGAEIVAEAVAKWPDGNQAGLILWGRKHVVTALEAYDMTPDSAKRMPTAAMLRTWEAVGEEQNRS